MSLQVADPAGMVVTVHIRVIASESESYFMMPHEALNRQFSIDNCLLPAIDFNQIIQHLAATCADELYSVLVARPTEDLEDTPDQDERIPAL